MPRKMVACLLFASLAIAAETQIKKVDASWTSPTSGSEMYRAHCAACHGKDGAGDGPAASALKVLPTDLTLLAKRNGGKFPELKVINTIGSVTQYPAHGSSEMPTWGSIFRQMPGGDDRSAVLRVHNLTKYVESIQKR